MKWLDGLRRQITRGATVAALRAAGSLGCVRSRSLGVSLGRFAHLLPWLRQRLIDNLHAAGMDSSDSTIAAYFRRLGLWIGHSLGVYQAGFDGSLAGTQLDLDPDSVKHFDDAVARGKGVVLAAPHLFCHEIAAALIHRRHPVTALVRESKDAGWAGVKDRWYRALGVQTVLRPRAGSAAGDMIAMLRVLRGGGTLGITPDVLTSRTSGLPVNIFGRTVLLSPGMILLAMRSGAPLITAGSQWLTDPTCPSRERLRVVFSEPLELPKSADRETALRDGLQRWCSHFETKLRQSPADWLFWLDKGWTKVLRQPATIGHHAARAA
ncbi:MAG: lysophospholipid acyltransferase family protein [Planctomycetia bacterium]|nr:lysophospholipid acyltransferase family protein [Planctomycetia bacterium]